jgi:hypothetical protein
LKRKGGGAVLFRFRCACCGKEVLTDSVLLKCCDKLMDHVENVTMTNEEMRSLMNGVQGIFPIIAGRG